MRQFDEFHLLVQPNIQDPTQWSIHVQKCPRNEFQGNHGDLPLQVTPADLQLLRNPTATPNLGALQQLGKKVMDSIMPLTVQMGLQVCLTDAQSNHRGLRVVVSMIGDARPPAGIRNHELPVEALFHQNLAFLGSNIQTPVSRGVATEPDREPLAVQAPLQILVIASEPTDMPNVAGGAEKTSILQALQQLINSNAVKIDFCEPATLARLDLMVQQKRYHVVHFIGHGDFEITGLDPTPQPHLYFEDNTPNRRRHAIDVEQLYTVLRNGSIPLVVLTACSTAASSPNGQDYPVTSFDSLAHALVRRQGGPSAAVAMQFDLETTAAPVFSKALYERLLDKEWSLDEAVASTRSALVSQFGANHRSWINPTVYWRCKEGRLFNLQPVQGDLSQADQKKIIAIDAQLEVFEDFLNELSEKSAAEQAAVANLSAQWQIKIQELLQERGFILGSTVRLRGGLTSADDTIECVLTIQLRLPATIGDIQVSVKHDEADLEFLSNSAGNGVATNSVFLQQVLGQPMKIMIQNASQGVSWTPGERELVKLKFKVKNPANKPLLYIQLPDAQVQRNGAFEHFQTLNATIFRRTGD